MTGMPARRLGLKKRGLLAPDMIADITVFDPETVQDHATFREGNAYATGMALVLLAGQIAQLTGVEETGSKQIPPPQDTIHLFGQVYGQIALVAIACSAISGVPL